MQRNAMERKPRKSRGRVRLAPYTPEWEGSIENWAVKFAASSRWRVHNYIDEDDLVCYFRDIFERVKSIYTVYDPAHFMSLFQTSCRNKVHDLSSACTRAAEVPLDSLSPEYDDFGASYDAVGAFDCYTDNFSAISAAVSLGWQRPEVSTCVEYLLMNDRPARLNSDGVRERSRDYYARVARIAWEAAGYEFDLSLDFDVLHELLNLTTKTD